MPHMTVAMGLSDDNLIPALISIKSMFASTGDSRRLSLAMFHDGISHYMTELVKTLMASHGVQFSLINMPHILSGFAYRDVICDEMLYSLLIPQYFTSRDFVLSIRAGSLVRGDVLSLLEQFPADRKIGAVRCLYHAHLPHDQFYGLTRRAREETGVVDTDRYFSRNLLLFNRKAISAAEGQACIQRLDEGWHSHDEAILNHLFQHDLHLFPQAWNIPMELLAEPEDDFSPIARQALAESRNDVKICQFPLSSPLDLTDRYAQEYVKIARSVTHDITDIAPQILCGSMWNTMSLI